MATKREYLIGKGLATEGRGRFSLAAKEELRMAELAGVTFDDEKPSKGVSRGETISSH
jgi:hypothetical protein